MYRDKRNENYYEAASWVVLIFFLHYYIFVEILCVHKVYGNGKMEEKICLDN